MYIIEPVCILLIWCDLEKIQNKVKHVHVVPVYLKLLEIYAVEWFHPGKRTVKKIAKSPKLTQIDGM